MGGLEIEVLFPKTLLSWALFLFLKGSTVFGSMGISMLMAQFGLGEECSPTCSIYCLFSLSSFSVTFRVALRFMSHDQ